MAPDPSTPVSSDPGAARDRDASTGDENARDESARQELERARQALERGDYGRTLALLKPLTAVLPPATRAGAQLQLLMATAWMGQGNSGRAMACCRQVKRCADPSLRSQARDLLEVLEAPALERPRAWSLTLPDLGEAEPLAGRLRQLASRRRRHAPPPPPAPPVGPTRAPVGFAVLVLSLLLLGLLLGGCVQIRAELAFGAPGRLQLVETLQPAPGQPAQPWQRRFAAALRDLGLRPAAPSGQEGGVGIAVGTAVDRLQGPMQPAGASLALLESSLAEAGRLAGLALPPPLVAWHERNWLLGVRQQLVLELDLRGADPVPGLEASLDLHPLALRAVHEARPLAAAAVEARGEQRLRWPLQLGALNRLDVRCWRWSRLGLGALAIATLLGLVLVLAGLRQRLGFGWPQLPA